VIAFHGVEDKIVPYLGGPSSRDDQFVFPAVEDWAANWAEHNSCAGTPEITQITDEINRTAYLNCEENARVIFYRVEGAGHTWPGGEKLPVWITGHTNQDINASSLMWDFFREISLESE
jgi:polyhydroxybutyrate depolymerase